MSWVKLKPGETFESLMKRFKKAVERSGVLADARKNEFYEKPSVKRKKKHIAAKKRDLKKQRKSGRSKLNASNKNFRWNSDRTKKIPMSPPKNISNKTKEFKKEFNKKYSKSRSATNPNYKRK
jgi:small subunit ribosomal protein S21